MPKYVLNRNHILSTLKGHRIAFKKGEPVDIPRSVVAEAVAIGATPADGSDPDLEQPVMRGEPPEAQDPEKRAAAVMEAIKTLVARNDTDDFGADNAPKPDAIRALVNFKVDVRERNDAWQRYHDLLAAEAGK